MRNVTLSTVNFFKVFSGTSVTLQTRFQVITASLAHAMFHADRRHASPHSELLPSCGTRNGIVAGPPFVRSKIALGPRRTTFLRSASASPYQAGDCRDALLA